MTNVLGVINLINEKPILKELTQHRCLASVPFAGRYRLIDFAFSNFIHAEINQVAVFTKDNGRSVMDHIGSGKEWDLDRYNGGLFILPPVWDDKQLRGDLEGFYNHIEFFERASCDLVMISPGHQVSKLDISKLIDFHERSQADITVVYKEYDGEQIQKPNYHQCVVDRNDNVIDLEMYTAPKKGDRVCLETYVLPKSLLMDLIKTCHENDEVDFLKDAIKANIHKFNVKGFHHQGNMIFIHSMDSFHSANMALLEPNHIRAFFYDDWEIFTKIKHEPPTKYGQASNVTNSFIANGCDIEGTVENSVIFRGVKIKKGAIVKNSILMQKTEVDEDAVLENVIADKQATVSQHKVVVGTQAHPKILCKKETI
ncbi:glucose-1-phosphate adenylyltransferase subunit GlgD [Heyndrickxia acidiproducens]|uniref:glucose-1-phosphate adenylyltransferase subunit GlgD n=1 Tax=Heyndrickxia acidiproducens TaxID=1121084 RepID=UPI00036767F7|nr:glucose-1-phosphate adenylyltransferase subunit GlgD [Heyndrickxia acidiproducens]